MNLSEATQQSLLTLVKKVIVSRSKQLQEVTSEVNFFYDKSDKADPATWQAFSMLNQARDVQRQIKTDIQKYAGLSKELKNSIRKTQDPVRKQIAQQKREASKKWLEAQKETV